MKKNCCWQICTGTFKNIFYILPISARCQVHWKIIFSTFKMHLRLPEHCCKCNFIHKNLCLKVQFCVSIQENQFLWIRKCLQWHCHCVKKFYVNNFKWKIKQILRKNIPFQNLKISQWRHNLQCLQIEGRINLFTK